MAVQTSYSDTISKAYDGQLADIGQNRIETVVIETEAGIAPGRVVSQGSSDKQVTVGGDATGIGILVRNLAYEGAETTNELTYNELDSVPMIKTGYIYLQIAEAAAKGTALYYVDADGTIGAATAGAGETQLTGCYLDETTTATNTIARCYIDWPATLS